MKQLFDIYSDWSFYLLLALLFLIQFSIAACHIIFTIIAVSFIIACWQRKLSGKLPLYFYFFLAYAFFTLVSSIFGIDWLTSLKDDKELFVFLLIPIYLVILSSEKRQKYSLYAVFTAAFLSGCIGIFQALTKGYSLDHRIKGFTSHWMTYSGLLMQVFIFFIVYFLLQKNWRRSWPLPLGLACALVPIFSGLVLSQTRSAWIGAAAGLFLFLIFYRPRLVFVAVPLVIALVYIAPAAVKTRALSIFDMKNDTNHDRFYMIYTGWHIFRDYPLTGVGPNNVPKVYCHYKHPQAVNPLNLHLHNNFMQVLAERGIFAFITLLAAFIAIIYQLIGRIRSSLGFAKIIAICALFLFAGFLAAGFFEYNFGGSQIRFMLFYFISLPFCNSKGEAHDHRQTA